MLEPLNRPPSSTLESPTHNRGTHPSWRALVFVALVGVSLHGVGCFSGGGTEDSGGGMMSNGLNQSADGDGDADGPDVGNNEPDVMVNGSNRGVDFPDAGSTNTGVPPVLDTPTRTHLAERCADTLLAAIRGNRTAFDRAFDRNALIEGLRELGGLSLEEAQSFADRVLAFDTLKGYFGDAQAFTMLAVAGLEEPGVAMLDRETGDYVVAWSYESASGGIGRLEVVMRYHAQRESYVVIGIADADYEAFVGWGTDED